MPAPKLKSSYYLGFIHTKRCLCCGTSKIEAHHESIHPTFFGSRKKYCDFTALPLCKEHHTLRHLIGGHAFWPQEGKSAPVEALKLLREYKEIADPRDFDSYEEYELEMEDVDDVIGVIVNRYKI